MTHQTCVVVSVCAETLPSAWIFLFCCIQDVFWTFLPGLAKMSGSCCSIRCTNRRGCASTESGPSFDQIYVIRYCVNHYCPVTDVTTLTTGTLNLPGYELIYNI